MQDQRSQIVCPCHDVTAYDIHLMIDSGHTSPETIKRSTSVYMGGCQGKFCSPLVQELLIERGIEDANTARRPAVRAPIVSLPLGAFVNADEDPPAIRAHEHTTTEGQ